MMKSDEDRTARGSDDALREWESRVRDFLEIASAWFWETDETLRITHVDGRPPLRPIEQVIGRTACEVLQGDPSASPWREHVQAMLAREPFRGFEVRVAAADGSTLWLSSSGQPVFAADGTFRGYRGIAVDITGHKRAEAEAQEKAAFLEATLEHMDQGLIMVDAQETVRVYNRKALELLGLPADLMRPPVPYDALRRHQLEQGEFARSDERFRRWIEAGARGGEAVHYERERPNGTVIEVRSVPLPDGGAVRIYTDVTARKAAEAEAREKTALLEATLEHMDQGLMMFDATETIRVYNHRVLDLLDLPEDLLAQRPNFRTVREFQLGAASSSTATTRSGNGWKAAASTRAGMPTSGCGRTGPCSRSAPFRSPTAARCGPTRTSRRAARRRPS
jgi:PAS domain S-box-containing protein